MSFKFQPSSPSSQRPSSLILSPRSRRGRALTKVRAPSVQNVSRSNKTVSRLFNENGARANVSQINANAARLAAEAKARSNYLAQARAVRSAFAMYRDPTLEYHRNFGGRRTRRRYKTRSTRKRHTRR